MPIYLKLGQKPNGFSLLELMITIAVFTIAMLAAFEVIISQRKSLKNKQELIEATQNARASQDILLKELRMSGYKVLEGAFLNSLSAWIADEYLPTYPKSVSLSTATCPIITQGDNSDPDMITIFMADIRENNLLSAAASGSTTITLDPNSPGFSNSAKFRVNDILRLGDHTEFARVVAVCDNLLTIDTNPSLTGTQGLVNSYAAGTPIREINIVTYAVINEANDPSHQHHIAGHPVLKRKHNEEEYMNVAEDVEDLQIIPDTFPNYRLSLVSRTATSSSEESDGYKHTTLLANFQLRNFRQTICPTPATPTITSISGLDASSPCTIQVNFSAVNSDVQNETLSAQCAVSQYIVAYATSPATRSYTVDSGTNTTCIINIAAIRDPNHPIYYISVAAINPSGPGAYSAEQTISDSSPPSAVIDLTASSGDHLISLSWTGQPECDVIAYHLYRGTSQGGPYTLIFTDTNITPEITKTYTHQDLNLPCATYYYLVRAYDGIYESYNPNETYATVTDNNPPAGPTNFSFTIEGSTVTFNWTLSTDDPAVNAQGDVAGYHIYALSGGNEILLDSSIPAGQHVGSFINTQDYSDFGLKAIDNCGLTSDLVTQPISCQPPSTVSIDAPSSGDTVEHVVTITGTASGTHTLLWVKVKIDNGQWIQTEGTDSWSYQWDTSNLEAGVHTVTAQVMDSEGCSGNASISVQKEEEATSDITPPSFGNIIQQPGGDPVEADQSVQICVGVSDPSGLDSVILNTIDFEKNLNMTDPQQEGAYCTDIPAHNGSTVGYSITATDNYQNQATIASSYNQATAVPIDQDPPVISNFSCTSPNKNGKTIQFTVTITDASGIASAIYTHTCSEGDITLTHDEGNTYSGIYTKRQKNDTCTITISATDEASNTATYTVSDSECQ